ncbi:MAG: sensor histidine kinase, partial [Acidimicrobiales bacterium]
MAALAYGADLLAQNRHHLATSWVVATLAGLEAVGLLALLWRARRPFRVLAVEAGVLIACDAIGGPPEDFRLTLLALATYSLVVRRAPPRALLVAAGVWVLVSGADLASGAGAPATVASHVVLFVASVASGLFIGSQRALLAAAHERAEQAERERNYHAQQAVADERVSIARELHDVVAHHVSLLVVQAGAVRENLPPEDPNREVLASMIDGGRHAMAELRAMLSALRDVGQVRPVPAPPP